MADSQNLPVDPELALVGYKPIPDLAQILLREANVHDGFYEVAVVFGVSVGRFQGLPTPMGGEHGVMTTVNGVGLRKVDELTPRSIDASVLNPSAAVE